MNYKLFKESLKYRNYSKVKIIIRFLEFKLKNLILDIIIKFNFFNNSLKPKLNLGSFKDDRYINFLIFSLKNNFLFSYNSDGNAKKLLKRIGVINFFKYTYPNNNKVKSNTTLLIINKAKTNTNEININTNYFKYFYESKKELNEKFVMPYYMYPRIYNRYYNKIKINKYPNFNMRIFFSGSIFKNVYGNFTWPNDNDKFPSRTKIIETIIKEFKNEIFIIEKKNDLRSSKVNSKKIILCLHEKMVKKQSYILNFKENFDLLNRSCFNLNCPGAVMPLCHHLIEGMKVGSIPITNCYDLVKPTISDKECLKYVSLDSLINQIYKALNMSNNNVVEMRENVFMYYKKFLSPDSFKNEFLNCFYKKNLNEIISCDDHRSVHFMKPFQK
jgi:hypothetical protein